MIGDSVIIGDEVKEPCADIDTIGDTVAAIVEESLTILIADTLATTVDDALSILLADSVDNTDRELLADGHIDELYDSRGDPLNVCTMLCVATAV
jgi:hypothetical protein